MPDRGRQAVLDEIVAVLEEQVTELEAIHHQRALLRRARLASTIVKTDPSEAGMVEPVILTLLQEVLSGRRHHAAEGPARGHEFESMLVAWDAAMQELRGTLASLEHRLGRLEHGERS